MTIQQSPTGTGRSRGREIALNVGAIAGLICVLAAAASFLFGIKPLVFRSGSMSPEITTGALALSKTTPASDLAVGDIVSVDNGQGTRITHRIHDVVSTDGTTSVLILKGDANKDADITPYTVTEADRVFFSVPGLGYAVSWLSSPAAIFLGGAFVGGLMVIAFASPATRHRQDDESDDNDSDDNGTPIEANDVVEQTVSVGSADATRSFSLTRNVPSKALIALGAVGLSVLGGSVAGTSAAFTDSSVASSSFTAAANFYPTPLVSNVTCSTSGTAGFRKATVSWTAPAGSPPLGGAWSYRVIVRRDNNASQVYDTYNQTSTTLSGYRTGATAQGAIVEVHTVNGSNVSTGWNGQGLWSGAVLDTYCSGGAQGSPNPAGENSVMGQGAETQALRMALGAAPTAEATTAAASSESASPTTTDPTTTAPATTTKPTTTAPTTTETTTSTTESTTPVPTTTTEEAAPPQQSGGDLAIANTSTSGNYTASVSGTTATITDKSGATVYSATVGKKAIVQWAESSDQLWIVDGSALTVVDAAAGTAESVDPTSSSVPAQVAALVTK